MIDILRALLLVSLGIPLLIFGLYGVFIIYYGKLKKNLEERSRSVVDSEFNPFVSVVVPTHNEEMIISKKIKNLLESNYPLDKLELIFVDDSDDSTYEIIQEYSKMVSNIHLIRFQDRMGYSPSMITGCKAAKGEIIVFNDAGSLLDSEAIRNLVNHLRNPGVGMVTGRSVILNLNEEVGKSESLYQKMYNFLRTAETNMDSTFYVKGEATAVRKSLIKDLETCSETFDTTAGLSVRQKGHKIVYDADVKFYEYAPSTRSGRVKQKTIRAANLIKVLWRSRNMMFKREYGKYGCIILPLNFAMVTIVPMAMLSAFTLLLVLSFFDLGSCLALWVVLGCVIPSLLAFSRHFLLTLLEFEYSLIRALCQVVFTKKTHDRIDKVVSTRRG